MNLRKITTIAILLLSAATTTLPAQSLSTTAKQRIITLRALIEKADKADINTLKEQTTIRTAEIFLDYAQWDEANEATNTRYFAAVEKYKNEAEEYAKKLADWEREEIIAMLDGSIKELSAIINGDIKRLDTPYIDWTKVEICGDEILFEGDPVFLADWTWKPRSSRYTEFHGNQDGFYLTPTFVTNQKGEVSQSVIDKIKEKESGSIGFIFLAHAALPAWAQEVDPTIVEGQGLKYTSFDINNPLSRKIQNDLYSQTIPLMADKQYTKLGYMLCNEPHWNCIEGEWAAGPISELAYKDFIEYLKSKHKKIKVLNKIWGTSYGSFDEIDIPRMRKAEEQGTPLYFDFLRYNMTRVTEWFQFLNREVKRYDPTAMTHIKIMPNLWSEGKRDSGIDMEAIIRNTDIIGNDAGSCGAHMWGAPQNWEASYSYDWRELCMAYDFFKSISPNKITYNTEGHMLSTTRARDLYQTAEYTRNNYWLAHIHGLTAIQTWYWARLESGAGKEHPDAKGYAASNNHQPRVVNEVHTTMLDLNSVSDYIMAFQRQRKPIRIFYTEASAINSQHYIDHIYDTYEDLFFEGTPLGFATKGIIESNNNDDWEVIVVAKTPQMFESDVEALQQYLNDGGTVIIDSESMLTNEYGIELKTKLKTKKGKLIRVSSEQQLKEIAFSTIEELPALEIIDKNGLDQKGCTWRVIEDKSGAKILNLVNLSLNPTQITIRERGSNSEPRSIKNVLTGESLTNNFELPLNGVLLLEVETND
ncbi:MAG: beta-galactosidase [Rikenellaceae bacterium]